MSSNPHDHDGSLGLFGDLTRMHSRRSALRLFGVTGLGAVAVVAAGCSSTATESTVTESTAGAPADTTAGGTLPATTASSGGAVSATTAAGGATCADVIPGETAGPFPGDSSNGPDVLSMDGVIRRDIRSSFLTSQTTAEGVPLTIRLRLVDATDGCTPLPNRAAYLWHCDREGRYSMYSSGIEDENYLRGVQPSDADGVIEFDTVFPGCYDGRWPHAHFEIFQSIDTAIQANGLIATSQVAFPEANCQEVYSTTKGYESSVDNLSRLSLESDNVFGDDGGVHQLGTVSGSADAGYVIELLVAVDPSINDEVGQGGGPGPRPGNGAPPPRPGETTSTTV